MGFLGQRVNASVILVDIARYLLPSEELFHCLCAGLTDTVIFKFLDNLSIDILE